MKMTKRRMLAALALVLFLCTPAMAALTRNNAERIWKRLYPLAKIGAPAKPIILERKKEPNAWIAFEPGKYTVHVTSGLLGLLKTEDELAGVFGHEMGHVKLGHYSRAMGRNLLWGILFYETRRKHKDWTIPAAIGVGLVEAGFSREQEVEADDFGARVAARAGYDPWGLYRAMLRMKNAGFKTAPNGFNSHPPTERRLLRLKYKAKALASGR